MPRILAVVLGQSNEKGNCQSPNGTPCPYEYAKHGNPLGNFNNVYGGGRGWWYIVADKLAQTNNIWLEVRNTAVSGTSIVDDWCEADGSGTPYAKDDAGFEAVNGYFTAMAAELAALGHWDEKWLFISIGHNDRSILTSKENFKQGYINAVEWAFANDVDKVFVGFTNHSVAAGSAEQVAWWADVGSPAIIEVIAYYANESRVYAGANLYETIGKGTACPLHDDNHLNLQGTQAAGEMWAKVISEQL